MRASIESALAAHAPVDAPTTWVLSNHDVTRPVTRYGRADTSFSFESRRAGTPTDLERGTRAARAAALLAMALPGSMYIYQGEELGLPEVEDIPAERRQDPMWLRSGGVDPGRDGRVQQASAVEVHRKPPRSSPRRPILVRCKGGEIRRFFPARTHARTLLRRGGSAASGDRVAASDWGRRRPEC